MFIIWGRKKDWGKQILRGLFFNIEHYDDAFSARFSSSVSFANEKKSESRYTYESLQLYCKWKQS